MAKQEPNSQPGRRIPPKKFFCFSATYQNSDRFCALVSNIFNCYGLPPLGRIPFYPKIIVVRQSTLKGFDVNKILLVRLCLILYLIPAGVVIASGNPAEVQQTPLAITQPSEDSQHTQTYEVSIPEQWKPYISAGPLTVVGPPFLSASGSRFIGGGPVIRVSWSLRNLTSDPVSLDMGYSSKLITTVGNTGYSVEYLLGHNEDRLIEDIIPVGSVREPVTFQLNLARLNTPNGKIKLQPVYEALATGALSRAKAGFSDWITRSDHASNLRIEGVKLAHSEGQGNAIKVTVSNTDSTERKLSVHVVAGDTQRIDHGVTSAQGGTARSKGSFHEATTTIKSNTKRTITVAYSIPADAVTHPFLGFRIFEPARPVPETVKDSLALSKTDLKYINRDVELLCWGYFDLLSGAERKQVELPSLCSAQRTSEIDKPETIETLSVSIPAWFVCRTKYRYRH